MGDLMLPEPKTPAAKAVHERQATIIGQLVGLDADQFLVTATIEANKLKADTTPSSVAKSVMNAACLGLTLGDALGHAYLVPFWDSKKRARICQLVVGYKGFLELALSARWLKGVSCQVVLKGEEFRHWATIEGSQIQHEMPVDRKETWENVTAAYCVYHTIDGWKDVEVTTREDLAKIHDKAEDWSPWKRTPIPMCRKTPLRRASKVWKQTGRFANAVMLDEMAERDELQPPLGPGGDVIDTPTRPPLSAYSPAPPPAADEPDQPEADADGFKNDT
jgi:recombination protein RecT